MTVNGGAALSRQGTLYAGCMVVFGAIVILGGWSLMTWLERPRWAAGVALGGGISLLIATGVFVIWLRALRRGKLWGTFTAGFGIKLFALVSGTLLVHFTLSAEISSAAFAVAFAAMILWVNLLGIPFLHKKAGRSRA